MVFAGKGFGAEGKFQMTCEYYEGDQNMPAATSSYTGEADLHNFLVAVLFGPGIKINGNRPIIGRLVELINRPVCVVRKLETDEGETVPVCSNCGEQISTTDSFCPHCSAEVVGNEFDC